MNISKKTLAQLAILAVIVIGYLASNSGSLPNLSNLIAPNTLPAAAKTTWDSDMRIIMSAWNDPYELYASGYTIVSTQRATDGTYWDNYNFRRVNANETWCIKVKFNAESRYADQFDHWLIARYNLQWTSDAASSYAFGMVGCSG